jgi:hypothetical protein
VVKLLLDSAADKEAKGEDEWTPLHFTSQNGNEAVVKLLLDRGADREARTKNQWTALHIAAQNGNEAVVKLLLAAQLDPNLPDDLGRTPLQLAVCARNSPIARTMAISGGDLDLLDCYGRSSTYWLSKIGKDPAGPSVPTWPSSFSDLQRVNRIKATVKSLIERLRQQQSSIDDSDWCILGKCLLFMGDHLNAAIAFEQCIMSREPLTHSAFCDACDLKNCIIGPRYVCSSCLDIDLCGSCYMRYNDKLLHLNGCLNHTFLEAPRDMYSKLGPGQVNLRGQTLSQWLTSMEIPSGMVRNLYMRWKDIEQTCYWVLEYLKVLSFEHDILSLNTGLLILVISILVSLTLYHIF